MDVYDAAIAAQEGRGCEMDVYDAAIAAQEGSQGCERFLRAPLEPDAV